MDLFEKIESSRNEEKAVAMSAYMKNLFPFIGLQAPERRSICKEYFKEMGKRTDVDWDFVWQCFSKSEREFQIIAIDYLAIMKRKIKESDLDQLETLITTKSWWDTVDSLSGIVGDLALKYPNFKSKIEDWGFHSENIWLIRTAIIFQLKYKEKTDTEFLSAVIQRNSGTKEFFINKAIGWALRQYSKTDSQWVKQFLYDNELSPLSVREASKYL
ncbi:MAG: DNA alkylation repair protein [Bacillus sp. (in: firmicutes)]